MADVILHTPHADQPTNYRDVNDVHIQSESGVLTFYSHGRKIQTTVPFIVEEQIGTK